MITLHEGLGDFILWRNKVTSFFNTRVWMLDDLRFVVTYKNERHVFWSLGVVEAEKLHLFLHIHVTTRDIFDIVGCM